MFVESCLARVLIGVFPEEDSRLVFDDVRGLDDVENAQPQTKYPCPKSYRRVEQNIAVTGYHQNLQN